MIKIVATIAGLLVFVVVLGLGISQASQQTWPWLQDLTHRVSQLSNETSEHLPLAPPSVSEPSEPEPVSTPASSPATSPAPADTKTAPVSVTNQYFQTHTTVNDLNLSQLKPNSLVYINKNATFSIIENSRSGKYLRSTGANTLPEWVSLVLPDDDDDDSGLEISDSLEKLSLAGADVPLKVGSNSPFQVLNSGRVELSYVGDSGYLSSSGGAIFINNTENVGTALGIFSNAGGEAEGNMINVKVDNPLFNQAAFYMNYDGLSNAVEIVSNTFDESSNALSVTNNNIYDSAVGIIGYELAKGTIKVSHYRPGTGNDSSASGLSIDLKGVGTRAQGVYVDSTEAGGTLGNLLRLRNESIDKFVVNYQGNLNMAGSQVIGAVGTDTTLTKQGNLAGDQFFVGTNASFRIQRAASNSEAFRTQIAGDTNGRWVGTSDGRLRWGDGTNASDVTLRRGSTGVLWLEGGMVFNNDSGNFDTVVKGDNESNLLFVDASEDRIGVGTSAPASRMHIVGGDLLLENTYALRMKDSAGLARPVLSYTSGNNVQLYNYATGGMLQIGLNNASNAAGNIRFFTNNNLERMRIDPAGVGIGATSFGTSSQNILAIANSVEPTSSITDGVQLYAIDQAGSHELRVRDEAGNATTLSPHNFSNLPDGPSEELAWSFFSERDGKSINVDMTRALRIVEQLSGEQLVYLRDTKTGEYQPAMTQAQLNPQRMGWVRDWEDTYIKAQLEKLQKTMISREELATVVEWGATSWRFIQQVEFMAQATFKSTVSFIGEATFLGAINVGKDTAGTVTIPANTLEVKVSFSRPYAQTPLVYLTPTTPSRQGYSLAEVTPTSFIIRLDQAWPEATSFNWLALVSKDEAQNVTILKTGPPPASPLPLVSPSPTPTPSAVPEDEPASSPKPSLEPVLATPSPDETVVLGESNETEPVELPFSEPEPDLPIEVTELVSE